MNFKNPFIIILFLIQVSFAVLQNCDFNGSELSNVEINIVDDTICEYVVFGDNVLF